MSEQLKCHAVSLHQRFKNQQGGRFGETCGVHLCLCKESKK